MKLFPFNLVEKAFHHKVDATGLAVFRVAYGITLFLQIVYIHYFQRLIFVEHTALHSVWILIWMFISILMVIGYKTRPAAVLNYFCTAVILNSLYGDNMYVYDYDKIMIAANFLLMFLPVSRVLSVDNWINRRKGVQKAPEVSILFYYMPMFICLGIPYLDSVYHKFLSMNWLTGVGIWVPMSMPQMTWPPFWDFTLVLNNRFLSYQMNYLSMVFELIFIFTFWFRRMRMILFVVGMGFHIGILLIFPIPLFAVGCASFYLLLLSPEWWRKWIPVAKSAVPPKTGIPAKIHSPKNILKDSHQIVLITLFFLISSVLQLGYFFNYVFDYSYSGKPYLIPYNHKYTPEQWKVIDRLIEVNQKILPVSKALFGIGPHDVMLDNQCENYSLILAIVFTGRDGKETWLPIIDEEGYPGLYAVDRGWSKWTHYIRWYNPAVYEDALVKLKYNRRITQPKVKADPPRLKKPRPYMIRIIEFWCLKNNVNCAEGRFTVKERYVIASQSWQKGIMEKQKNYIWKNMGEFLFTSNDIRINFYGDSLKMDSKIPR